MSVRRSMVLIQHESVVGRRQASRLLVGGVVALVSLGSLWTQVAAQEPSPDAARQPGPEGAPPRPGAVAISAESRNAIMLAYAAEVFLEIFRLPDGQTPRHELHATDQRTNTLLNYSGPSGQEIVLTHSVDPAGNLRFLAALIRVPNVHNAREHITANTVSGTLAAYFLPFPDPFTSAVWNDFRQPSGAPTIERAWDNDDGTVEVVAASLWGQNAPNGPGNYLVVRARLYPGSPHHEKRTLFTS
jgi:hypothetical protein